MHESGGENSAQQLTTLRLLLDERGPQPVLCLCCVWLALPRLCPGADLTNLIFWDRLPLGSAACRMEVQLQQQVWMTFQRPRPSQLSSLADMLSTAVAVVGALS